MKKALAAILAAFVGAASAAGTYDGIYQVGATQEFYSVHQSGTHVVAGIYYVFPRTTLIISPPGGQGFAPPQTPVWDLLGGQATSANTAQLTGQIMLGMCNAVVNVVFDPTQAQFTIVALTNTSAATTQGFSCPAVLQGFQAANGGVWRYSATKIL